MRGSSIGCRGRGPSEPPRQDTPKSVDKPCTLTYCALQQLLHRTIEVFTVKEQLENALTRVADSARNTVNTAVDATQEQVGKAGKMVADGKKPVAKLSKAGVDINGVTFRLSKDLIELQTKSVVTGIDAVADGLDAAARADSIGGLLAYQRDTLPKVLSGYVTDIRDAFDLVRGAATDVGGIVIGLRDKPAPKKARAKKKTTRKTAARKAPAKKAKTKTKAAAKKVAQKVAEVQETTTSA